MKRIVAIGKYFFRKNVKDIISFSVILSIATIMFSGAVVLNNNVSKAYDEEFDKLNTASCFFTIPSAEYSDILLEDIKNIDGITDAEMQRGVMLTVPVNMEGSVQEQSQIFYNIDESFDLNKRDIISETEEDVDLGIYLSNYTFIHSGLNIKDKYTFEVDNAEYSFTIKGVVSEMQYGNYTSSVIGEYLEGDAYSHLLEDNQNKEVVTISVKSSDSRSAYNDVSKYLSSKNINILNKNYKENAKNQKLAISNILILILMVFSGVMLIISLFVSKFKIEQSIEDELANMGALQALGYTSNQIITACIFPYIMSGLIFTLLGVGLSYFVLPLLSKVIEMQSGFIWQVSFDLVADALVLCVNMILILLFTVTASLKIKKLNPINALRGLTEQKNYKNYFEIEKAKGNIHFILMLKNFVNTKKQNILLAIVLFFVTIVSSFVGILFYNINMHPINFINTLVEEHPSAVISSVKDLRSEIEKKDNVKNVLYYDESSTVNYKDNSYKTFVADNFENVANDLCYEGSNPKNNDEVALGSKIRETYNLNIGDYVTLSKNGIKKEYKVVGFVQSVNYSGEIIEITVNGYKKLDESYSPITMYVYLNDEDKAGIFIDDMKEKYDSDIISTMNYAESMDSAMEMYVSLISVICIIIIVITLLLIYLILYIVISSIITRRKQELGIFKAIGYENKQLVRQLVGGFMPGVVAASAVGLVVGKLFIHNMYSGIFKAVGAYKVSFEYPLSVFVIIAIFLILSTVVIATVLSGKIKKISVYSLIKD